MKTMFRFLVAFTCLTFNPCILQAQSNSFEDDLYTAQLELSEGDASTSYQLVSGLVLSYPDSSKAWYLKSQIERQVIQYKNALVSIQKANILEPGNPAYYFQTSRLYSDLQQYDLSISYCDSVISSDPNHVLASILKAQVLQKNEKFQESIDQYNSLLQADSTNINFMKRIGSLYSKLDSLNDAIFWFSRALEIDSSDINSYTHLGNLFVRAEMYEEGIPVLSRAIMIDSTNSWLYRFRGSLNLMSATFVDAETDLRKAISLGDSTAFTFRHLGLALFKQSEYQDALPVYETTIKLDPGDAQAWFYLAYCYKWAEDLDKAITCMEKALELSVTPSISDVYKGLAEFHGFKRDYDLAMNYYGRAYEWNPTDPLPLAEMGMLIEQTGGEKEEAKKLYQTYLEKADPQDILLKNYIEERVKIINEKLFMEGKLNQGK